MCVFIYKKYVFSKMRVFSNTQNGCSNIEIVCFQSSRSETDSSEMDSIV